MKVAITVWNNRVSPVFDVARNVMILDISKGDINQKSLEVFTHDAPQYKASRLNQLQVSSLICGAISSYQARIISHHRIKIIPFITGEIEEIIDAFISDRLPNPKLMMPGCCRRQNLYQSAGHQKMVVEGVIWKKS